MKKEHQLVLSLLKDYIPKCEKHLESLNEMIGIYTDMEGIAEMSKTDFDATAERSVLQFNFLLTNSDLELNLIFKNLLNSEYKWERIYFLKLAGLNIYETLKSYNKHRKPIKEIASRLPQLESDCRDANKSIALFINEFSVETKLYKIRNKTIAHIEADIKEYFDIVSSLDYDRSVEMILRFLLILRDLQELSIGCLTVSGPAIAENFDFRKNFDDLAKKLKDFIEKK